MARAMTGQGIWRQILREAPKYQMDYEYLKGQARVLQINVARLRRLWSLCEEHPEAVLDIFEAFEFGVLGRGQFERILLGELPVATARLFLAEYKQAAADELGVAMLTL